MTEVSRVEGRYRVKFHSPSSSWLITSLSCSRLKILSSWMTVSSNKKLTSPSSCVWSRRRPMTSSFNTVKSSSISTTWVSKTATLSSNVSFKISSANMVKSNVSRQLCLTCPKFDLICSTTRKFQKWISKCQLQTLLQSENSTTYCLHIRTPCKTLHHSILWKVHGSKSLVSGFHPPWPFNSCENFGSMWTLDEWSLIVRCYLASRSLS